MKLTSPLDGAVVKPWNTGRHAVAITKSYRAVSGGCAGANPIRIHTIRAERALGKPLPLKAVVHHADGTRDDNAQLVICQDQACHLLLHRRMRIVRAGGDPNTQSICRSCGPQPVERFSPHRNGRPYPYCRSCRNNKLRGAAA